MGRYSKFGRGGCFTCEDCGRKTRETDRNAGLDGFCGDCAELAQLQNGFSDTDPKDDPNYAPGGWAQKESLALRKAIVANGGTLNDSMTWAESDPLPLEPTTTEKLGLTLSPDSKHAVAQAVDKVRKEASSTTRAKLRTAALIAWAPGGCLRKHFDK